MNGSIEFIFYSYCFERCYIFEGKNIAMHLNPVSRSIDFPRPHGIPKLLYITKSTYLLVESTRRGYPLSSAASPWSPLVTCSKIVLTNYLTIADISGDSFPGSSKEEYPSRLVRNEFIPPRGSIQPYFPPVHSAAMKLGLCKMSSVPVGTFPQLSKKRRILETKKKPYLYR